MGKIMNAATELYEGIQSQIDQGRGVYLLNKEEMILVQTYILMVNKNLTKEDIINGEG